MWLLSLVLDGKLLARAVVTAVHEICQEWRKTLPPLTCPRERREFSIYAMKNGRRKMEDRHSICVDLNSLYGLKVGVWMMCTMLRGPLLLYKS